MKLLPVSQQVAILLKLIRLSTLWELQTSYQEFHELDADICYLLNKLRKFSNGNDDISKTIAILFIHKQISYYTGLGNLVINAE